MQSNSSKDVTHEILITFHGKIKGIIIKQALNSEFLATSLTTQSPPTQTYLSDTK